MFHARRIAAFGIFLLAAAACAAPAAQPSPSDARAPTAQPTASAPTATPMADPTALPTATPAPAPHTPTPVPEPTREPRKIDLGSGKLAPDFEIELVDGEKVTLSSYQGKVVLLNFWGTWCPPCRAEMPALQRIWEEYEDRGVVFLGVAIYDEPAEVEDFAESYGITYPLGIDTLGHLTVSYRVTSFPTTFLIDREGNETRRIVNPVNEGFLRIFLNGMLKDEQEDSG